LTGGTTYHYRIVATNELGTTYGDNETFTTDKTVSLSTNSVTRVTYNSAFVGGNIENDVGFAITSRGVCWSKNPNPTIINEHIQNGSGVGSFSSEIKCLDELTTYYIRAFATYTDGIVYGNQVSFNTEKCPIAFNPDLTYGKVMDIDGNCYKTIQIGNQTWMAEKLKTSRYNDGTPIPNVADPIEWDNLLVISYISSGTDYELTFEITGAFCWYNNDSSAYEAEYGKLYNFGAAESEKLCPTGWHVPNSQEWHILCDPYEIDPNDLSGISGNELMETTTIHWNEPLGSNEVGFTVLPGGRRLGTLFEEIRTMGYFWTSDRGSTMYGIGGAFYMFPYYSSFPGTPLSSIMRATNGFSIRCIKD
jgi:uncharacterized protein (TIGR02145 family)